MANLNPMKVGKVVGQFLANVADGPDIGFGPDYPPLEGHIYFTARAHRVAVRDGDPNPATFFGTRHDVVLDEFGYLTHNGSRGVMLAVPSPDTQPYGWTWLVEFDLSYLGQKITTGAVPFDIEVPEYTPGPDPDHPDVGSTGLVDLALVVPVIQSTGESIVTGRGITNVALNGSSTALVFSFSSGAPTQTVTIPALTSAAADAATAETARASAQNFSAIAGLAATLATEKAEAAAASATDSAQHLTDGGVTTSKLADGAVVDSKVGASAAIAQSKIAGLTAALTARELTSNKGAANGYAPLGSDSKVPAANLPAYVDDILEYANLGAFPATGSSGLIYVALDTNKIYRWSGSAYVVVSDTLAIGTTGSTAAAGNDPRLSDTRTPSANTVPCDFVWIAQSGVRATGIGDLAVGQYVGRAFTVTKVIYQFDSADASGSTSVEIRRNGVQVTSSNLTVTAANQADGTGTDSARTATFTQSFAVGDRFSLWCTAIGTTPGKGLRAYVFGTWN